MVPHASAGNVNPPARGGGSQTADGGRSDADAGTDSDADYSGELSWTKAREITGVATPETEAEWLEKARALSNRDLEREVRRHAGQDSGAFATVTISMPVEILAMWNDAYELAERVSGTELEKWQVLEPSLAEFLGTHLPTAENGA